jgi:hypothetical protein
MFEVEATAQLGKHDIHFAYGTGNLYKQEIH